jgi:hypothetical protein
MTGAIPPHTHIPLYRHKGTDVTLPYAGIMEKMTKKKYSKWHIKYIRSKGRDKGKAERQVVPLHAITA